jgi:alpha-D-ribose 1-methylphosphonate 5-triphosphate synthase subunit PhnG
MVRARRTRVLVESDPVLARELCLAIEALCVLANTAGEAAAEKDAANTKKSAATKTATEKDAASSESEYVLRVLSEPREVLVMNCVRESAGGSLFYLGEALLSECRVAIGSTVGIGMALGATRERAYQLAVIDAAFNLPRPLSGQVRWQQRLLDAERALARVEAQRCRELQATKVEFLSMLTEEDRKGSDV